jgi:hypothetical protein
MTALTLASSRCFSAHFEGVFRVFPRRPGPRKTTEIQAALTVIGRRSARTGLVDLAVTHIPRASLSNANLSAAYLMNADLSGTTVSQTQLDEACGAEAKLPSGLNTKPCDSPNDRDTVPRSPALPRSHARETGLQVDEP